MAAYPYTALFSVQATGDTEAQAREYARGELDDHLARLDAQHPAGSLSTGPVTLVAPLHLRALAEAIRGDAHDLITGASLTRSVPLHRIRDRAEKILAALDAVKEDD